MQAVLMVCLGNICRSPLAEGILKDVAHKKGVHITVDSAGTGNWHVGEAPDYRSIEVAQKHGIDIRSQRARHFTPADFDDFDYILVMDSQNFVDVIRQAPSDEARQKVDLIMNWAEPGKNKGVPDPYYGGLDGFENVYTMLTQACTQFIEHIAREK